MITAARIAALIAPETVDAGMLTELIVQNTAILGRALNRYLGPVSETVEKHSGGRGVVFLYDAPLEGGDLVVETRHGIGYPWTEVEPTDYEVDDLQLRHTTCWPRGVANVQVSYERGFPVGQGPAELRAFVERMTLARLREDSLIGAGALRAETIGDHRKEWGGSESWDPTGLDGWQALARQWRRQRL